MEEEGLPCCLSHAFSATAARFPDRIAVVDVNPDEKILDGEPLQNRPTMYPGDRVYTYKELEDSANSLAARLDWEFGAHQHGGSSKRLQIMESKGGAPLFGSDSRTHSKECQLEACPISTGAALYSTNGDNTKCPGKVVGIMIGNSAAYLISVLAVLRAGGIFVPLDPSWPTQRIAEIVADSHIFLVLVCNHNGGLLEASNLKSFGVKFLDLSQYFSLKNVKLEQFSNCFAMKMPFCYIIYTSGSSGKPKGVCGTEKGLLNRLYWMGQAYPYGRDEIACFKTSIGFIDHLTESLGPLLMGITLVVPPTCGLRHDPASLLQYIKAYRITRLTAVPSLMLCLLPALASLRGSQLASIRVLILSGETLPFWLYKELQYMMSEATILNLYGSTEVSGDCTYFDCKLTENLQQQTSTISVPIGKAIPGFSLLICDGTEFSNSRKEGELCVSGIGLAHGYVNDTAGTAGKFVQLGDSSGISVESNRVFKTGDLVREVGDGNFAFLGRVDRLIKIHGQRIEQEEIEIVLKQHPSVAHAAVLYTGAQLAAYIMPSSEGDLVQAKERMLDAEQQIQKSIRKWLTNRLPLYMLPGRFIFLKRMPLTQSGKVDYSALSDMEMCKPANKEIVETESDYISALEHIKRVFASVLMVQVSSSDDFFLLGGTSVSAAQAAYVLGVKVQLLYEHKTPLALLKAMKDTEIFSRWLHGESDFKIQEVRSSEPPRLDYLQDDKANLTLECQRIYSLNDGNRGRPSAVNDENNYVRKPASGLHQEIDEGGIYPAKRRKQSLVTGIEHESHAHKNTSLSDGPKKSCWPFPRLFSEPTAIVRCNRVITSYPYKRRQTICEHSPKTSCSKRWSLRVTWKCALSACIDASPLLVFKGGVFRIYIGSHAHVFMCLDACSGHVRWQCHLGGRIESTASITLDFMQVVVGCYDGFIYFLDLENGNELWKYKTGAEVKCQPVVDVKTGLIWCGSHDHKIYALDPISRSCVWELDCGGSIFAAPAINADRVMYVGTTSGMMMAILLEPLPKLAWKYDCGGPLFGSPAADPCTRQVIIASVGGHVIALTEDGSLAWQAMVDSPIFAGVCISSVFSHLALVCSRGGCVYAFSLLDGVLLWKFAFSEPITTAVWVDEELELSYAEKKSRLICVTGTTGNVYILEVELEYKSDSKNPAEHGHLSPHLIATLNLHGEIFSSPIMVNGRIFVGCRDNNIYCIDLCKVIDE